MALLLPNVTAFALDYSLEEEGGRHVPRLKVPALESSSIVWRELTPRLRLRPQCPVRQCRLGDAEPALCSCPLCGPGPALQVLASPPV